MFLNITPLIKYRDYRLLYIGQLVSFFGSMITMVALPFQIYQLTHSSLWVGLLSAVELIPLLFTALIGGVFADRFNRRKLLLCAEILLMICCALLVLNSLLPRPSLLAIFVIASLSSAIYGFHRPSLEAMTQLLVEKADLKAVSILHGLKYNLGMILCPSLTGLLISHYGISLTLSLDAFSYFVSLLALYFMHHMPSIETTKTSTVHAIKEGVRYAMSRQEIFGSYLVDIIAMIFGMSNALFPAIASQFGGAAVLGLFYSAPSVGALVFSLTSGWTAKIKYYGWWIAFSSLGFGVAIILFGLSTNLWIALFFLALAGGADTISGIFRMTLWNETIPTHLRGRLAGIEMISYMSGPMLGNAEAGCVAALFGVTFSIVSGGVLCVGGVILASVFLPKFLAFQAKKDHEI